MKPLHLFGLPGFVVSLAGAALTTPTLLAQAAIVDPNLSTFDKYGIPGLCLLGLYLILSAREKQVDKLLAQLDETHKKHAEFLQGLLEDKKP